MARLGRALQVSPFIFSSLFHSLITRWASRIKNMDLLFAALKLLNVALLDNHDLISFTLPQTFACLARRIPLEFNLTTDEPQDQQKLQVESHMRICLHIDPTFDNMVTLSASESLLSEAAYCLMQNPGFQAEKALLGVFCGFSVQGDRGDYVGLLLIILARDAVVRAQNGDAMWKQISVFRDPELKTKEQSEERNRLVPVPVFIEALIKGLPDHIRDLAI